MNELDGKAAIITGAGKGIGAAVARELARCGVSVLLAARTGEQIKSVARGIHDAGGIAEAKICDVSRYSDVMALVERCKDTYGRVDILVNNAAVIEPIMHLKESCPDQWSKIVDINYKGVYYGMRAVIPVMEAQDSGGTIINITSGAATSALEGWSHYCSTKAAVSSLTRCADKECGDKGIRVIGLSPGTVATDLQHSIKISGINPVSKLDWDRHIPVEWPARAVAYLCTSDADDLTGSDFSIKNDEGRKRVGLI